MTDFLFAGVENSCYDYREIARLMEDFHQKDSENMHYKALADSVRHFKEKAIPLFLPLCYALDRRDSNILHDARLSISHIETQQLWGIYYEGI
jgi:hypothetical protein